MVPRPKLPPRPRHTPNVTLNRIYDEPKIAPPSKRPLTGSKSKLTRPKKKQKL